jgi:predicted ATPase
MSEMKKIKSLTLENFQSHKHLYVEFSEALTIITGTNNSGKTAIFRALDYVYNFGKKGHGSFDPSYVSHKAAFCKIIVEFVDGTKLVRVKSGSKGDKNSIQIYNKEDELIYEKLKADKAYDQFVTDFLGNPTYDEEMGSLAFVEQNQPPFLISLTPLKIPEAFARLIKSSDFDNAVKILKSENNSYSSSTKTIESDIVDYEQDLIEYEGLDDLIKIVEENDEIILINDELDIIINNLNKIREDALNYRSKIKFLEKENVADQNFLDQLEDLDSFTKLKQKINNLKNIKVSIENMENSIEQLVKENEKDSYLISEEFLNIWNGLSLTYKDIKNLTSYDNLLALKESTIQTHEQSNESDEVKIQNYQTQIDSYIEDNKAILSEIDVCPVCDKKVKND